MKKKSHLKFNKKRIILNLLIISSIIFIGTHSNTIMTAANSVSGKGSSSTLPVSEYEIIKEDINEKYSGKRTRKSI